MATGQKVVFVLGAGFTKAFFPNAPLVEDDYGGEKLLRAMRALPYAKQVLEWEINREPLGKINIERLMTRIDQGMPYDSPEFRKRELLILKDRLRRQLLLRLSHARSGPVDEEALAAFARLCVTERASCVTFNYDDFLDRALWQVMPLASDESITSGDCWHPSSGYGFYCRPSWVCVRAKDVMMQRSSMGLLKLHGATNWAIRRGYTRPYPLEAVVHNSGWYLPKDGRAVGQSVDPDIVNAHLQEEVFIVPPVLEKSALLDEPILRCVWEQAHQCLMEAEVVVFLGYSLPVTDIAAKFLFSESIQRNAEIRVVNKKDKRWEQTKLRQNYERAMGRKLPKKSYVWKDAKEWCRIIVQNGIE